MSTVQLSMVGLVIVLSLSACGRGPEPPRPTESLVPETVGMIVRWDWFDCVPGRYTLDSGQEIVLSATEGGGTRCSGRLYTPTPRLSDTRIRVSGEPGETRAVDCSSTATMPMARRGTRRRARGTTPTARSR